MAADEPLETLAAAPRQHERPAANDRGDHLPGAGDSTLGRLSPHTVLPRAACRHLFRAPAGGDHRPQPPRQAEPRRRRRLPVRARGRLPRRGRHGPRRCPAPRLPGRPTLLHRPRHRRRAGSARARGAWRDVADEGLLYSFDPIASLRIAVELPPHGAVELAFVDGYAADETVAAAPDRPRAGPADARAGAACGRVRPQPQAGQQPARPQATRRHRTISPPTAPSWSSPARRHAPGPTSWPTRSVTAPSFTMTAKSSPSPATRSRTR